MPPRRFKKKSIKRLVEKRVAKAIEEYEKSRANLDSAGSSGGNPGNAGGTMNVHGCSHKTFMNGKPHTFNGTEGVVGLRRWIEKVEQVFKLGKCDDYGIMPQLKSKRGAELGLSLKLQRSYAAAPAEGRDYAGNIPKCNRCNSHHKGQCPPKCGKCGRLGYEEKDCRVRRDTTRIGVLREGTIRMRELVRELMWWLKTRSRIRMWSWVRFFLMISNACILFDSVVEKSFVSSAFTPFIDIAPTTLNTSYEVELADGKVVSTNTVLRGCTLVLLNHVFKIDLLPTRLGSFDVIVGMDWLSYHRAVIDCYEKIVRIPLLNGENTEVQGERPEKDPGSLACIKADEKKLDDIRFIRDFPKVFPDDLLGLPPVREIEFRIDLIPGIAKPLTLLTQKNKTYVWGNEQDEAFRILKEKLCNAPVLALPDGPDDFVVYCDASKQGGGSSTPVTTSVRSITPGQGERWWQMPWSRKERLSQGKYVFMSITISFWIKTKILEAQGEASKDLKAPAEWLQGLETHFERRDDGGIYFFDHIWILSVGGVRKLIMDEAHTIIPY
ncbi:putative reverse transcriptase domain-containing protein [Tanacetum coccineum]